MYIAICDDHPQELKKMAAVMDRFSQETGQPVRHQLFSDPEELLTAAKALRFSHYFLDVMMPSMDGITVAQEIRIFDQEAKIVFTTSFKEYAYQSYRVKASDYLLKPVREEQLLELLRQFHRQASADDDCLSVQTGRGFFRVPFSQLSFLEVYQKKLYFHTKDQQVRTAAGAMAEYEQALMARPEFVKIHRSYIVNLSQVSSLSAEGCLLFTGENLPISRLLFHQVRERYMRHLFSHEEVLKP